MVFIRTKGVRDWARPSYGQFRNMPYTEYVGGDWAVFDWVKGNEVKCIDLEKFSEQAGVKGKRRYYLNLEEHTFVLCGTDKKLQKWALKNLGGRMINIYCESLQADEDPPTVNLDTDSEYESYEDSDYAIGNEIEDDDDDRVFESHVDNVEEDLVDIDPSNITQSSVFVECPITENEGVQAVEGGGLGSEGVKSVDKGKRPIPEESSEDDTESENEGDVVEVVDDFDEHRLSEDDAEVPNYPVFNPNTTYNPEFHPNQIFATKKEFKLACQSHAIKVRRSIKFLKNDDRRVYVRCRVSECKWMINLLKRKGTRKQEAGKLPKESWELMRRLQRERKKES